MLVKCLLNAVQTVSAINRKGFFCVCVIHVFFCFAFMWVFILLELRGSIRLVYNFKQTGVWVKTKFPRQFRPTLPEDGGSKILRNVGIIPHHYMSSQPREDGDSKVLREIWYPVITLHGVTTQWRWRQQGPPKHWCPTTSLHGVTTHWGWRQWGLPKRRYSNTTLRHNPEDIDLNRHCIESLKSHIKVKVRSPCHEVVSIV
jgi:hypothetical protein